MNRLLRILPFRFWKMRDKFDGNPFKTNRGDFSKVSANAIKYYRFNGTEQYLEKYYLVYNEMCTDLTSSAVQESSIVMKEYFKTN